jgi:hypothetical protein
MTKKLLMVCALSLLGFALTTPARGRVLSARLGCVSDCQAQCERVPPSGHS